MKTYYGQYCRVETKAGGVRAPTRAFLRAAVYGFLSPMARTRQHRAERHEWLRDLLAYRAEAQGIARRVGA